MDRNRIINDIFKKIDISNFNPGSTHKVEVTHINDPGSFYVRLVSLFEIVRSLEVKGSPISQQLDQCDRVIYKSATHGKLVRGDIETVNSNGNSSSYTIHAIDYGGRDTNVPQEDLYQQGTNVDCPAMALHCKLHLCEPLGDTFDDTAINGMKDLVGKHAATMTVQCRTALQLVVDLSTSNAHDLATVLMMLKYCVFIKRQPTVNRFVTSSTSPAVIQYKYKHLSLGDKLPVRVQYGESMLDFHVAEMQDYKKYERAKHQFNRYCRQQKLEDVVAAAADKRGCGVKHGGYEEYERAIVIKVTKADEKALVKLIDWGKILEVKFDDIKSVDSEYFYQNPAVAIYCSATSATEPWQSTLPKFLFPGYEFIIEVLQVGDGIDVPHVVNLQKIC